MPRQMPKNGTLLLARVADRRDLALGAASAEAGAHEDAVDVAEQLLGAGRSISSESM